MEPLSCVAVGLWGCGAVELCSRGSVELWSLRLEQEGAVELCSRGAVELWSRGAVKLEGAVELGL